MRGRRSKYAVENEQLKRSVANLQAFVEALERDLAEEEATTEKLRKQLDIAKDVDGTYKARVARFAQIGYRGVVRILDGTADVMAATGKHKVILREVRQALAYIGMEAEPTKKA